MMRHHSVNLSNISTYKIIF